MHGGDALQWLALALKKCFCNTQYATTQPPAFHALVGRTPIIRLRALLHNAQVCVYIKAEQLNPSGSVFDRYADKVTKRAPAHAKYAVVSEKIGGEAASLAMALAPAGYRVRARIAASQELPTGTKKLHDALGVQQVSENYHVDDDGMCWDADSVFQVDDVVEEVRRDILDEICEQMKQVEKEYASQVVDVWFAVDDVEGGNNTADKSTPLCGLKPTDAMAWIATNEGLLVSPRTAALVARAASALSSGTEKHRAIVVVAHETGERYVV